MKKQSHINRRKLITLGIVGGGVLTANKWVTPLVNSVVLPAHAQTSGDMCMTDTTVGGPLVGHPSGATTCQAACEAEATDRNAQLCEVIETVDDNGATQCDCELDLP